MPGFLADALSQPLNYKAALAVETAYQTGIAPSVFLYDNRQPSDPWTKEDKKLLVAWTILQKETCQECGQPLWICRSNNKELTFSVKKTICYAKAEMEKWDKKHGKDLKPGEIPYVLPRMLDEADPLPGRQEYLEQLVEDE